MTQIDVPVEVVDVDLGAGPGQEPPDVHVRVGEVDLCVHLGGGQVLVDEPLQVDDKDGREPPDLELLDCELVGFAGRAVILLVLSQLFLLGESLQTFSKGDRLSSSPPVADKYQCRI